MKVEATVFDIGYDDIGKIGSHTFFLNNGEAQYFRKLFLRVGNKGGEGNKWLR